MTLHKKLHPLAGASDHTIGSNTLVFGNGSGVVTELALGVANAPLVSKGAGVTPAFEKIDKNHLASGFLSLDGTFTSADNNTVASTLAIQTFVNAAVAGANQRIADPVQNITALKAVDTTSAVDFPDRIIIYVEHYDDASAGATTGGQQVILALDRQSSSTEDLANGIVQPTTGSGRWLKAGVFATDFTASLGVQKVGNDFRADFTTTGGLELATNSLKLKLDTNPGLALSVNGLILKLDTNPGLVLGAGGLIVKPDAVGSAGVTGKTSLGANGIGVILGTSSTTSASGADARFRESTINLAGAEPVFADVTGLAVDAMAFGIGTGDEVYYIYRVVNTGSDITDFRIVELS